MNAPEIVDLIDKSEALTGRGGIHRVIVLAANIDASRWTDSGAQLTADALLHAVFVAVQDVTSVQALWLVDLLIFLVISLLAPHTATGVFSGNAVAASVLTHRDEQASEVTH
jgi:hypothetical protein